MLEHRAYHGIDGNINGASGEIKLSDNHFAVTVKGSNAENTLILIGVDLHARIDIDHYSGIDILGVGIADKSECAADDEQECGGSREIAKHMLPLVGLYGGDIIHFFILPFLTIAQYCRKFIGGQLLHGAAQSGIDTFFRYFVALFHYLPFLSS